MMTMGLLCLRVLSMTLIGVTLLGVSSGQFIGQNGRRNLFDSDEFDRSRERNSFEFNSIERDSDEVFRSGSFGGNNRNIISSTAARNNINTFLRNNNNNLRRGDSIEVDSFGRVTIDRDSDEVSFRRNFGQNRNSNNAVSTTSTRSNINTFLRNNNLRRGDSLEVDSFGRVTIDRDSDEVRFRSGNSRGNNNRNNVATSTAARNNINTFLRNNNNNLRRGDSIEVDSFGRVTIDRDSDEVRFRSGNSRVNNNRNNGATTTSNRNSINTFLGTNNLRPGDSIEVNSFGRVTIDRDSDEIGFRRGNFRNNNRNNAATTARNNNNINNFLRNNNLRSGDSLEVDSFGRVTIDRDSDEVRFRGNNRNPFTNFNNQQRNTLRNNNFLRRDSDEVIVTNSRGTQTVVRVDSDEVVRPFTPTRNPFTNTVTRNQNANRNRNPFTANRQNNNLLIRDDSIEIVRPFNRNNANNARNQNPFTANRNLFRQSVSLELNSIENDSPEDILDDLFDDDADDRARARLAIQRLNAQRQQNNRAGGRVNSNTFGRPLPQNNRPTTNPFITASRNNLSNNRNNVATNSNSLTRTRNQGSSSFPPLPRTPARTTQNNRQSNPTTNTIVSSNTLSRNNNRANLNTNSASFNFNNPFLSRTSTSSRAQNVRPIPPLIQTSRPSTQNNNRVNSQRTNVGVPLPSTSAGRTNIGSSSSTGRNNVGVPLPSTRTVTTPTTSPTRSPSSIPSPPRRNQNNNNSQFSHFTNAARQNQHQESKKPSNNPFIKQSNFRATSNSIKPGNQKIGSVGGFNRSSGRKPSTSGFEWPGGNGYFFRMSTGNSKPIQYFISYDD